MIKIPIIGKVIVQSVLVRFCRSLSVLLTQGVPLVRGLRLAKEVMNNPLFEKVVTDAEKGVVEGRRLSETFDKSSLIPPLVCRMLIIAESSGNAAPMLGNIATVYEEELNRTITTITTLLQPAMLVILGSLIALVVLSVMLPLTDVQSMIGG